MKFLMPFRKKQTAVVIFEGSTFLKQLTSAAEFVRCKSAVVVIGFAVEDDGVDAADSFGVDIAPRKAII
jgi:hypothetical protein